MIEKYINYLRDGEMPGVDTALNGNVMEGAVRGFGAAKKMGSMFPMVAELNTSGVKVDFGALYRLQKDGDNNWAKKNKEFSGSGSGIEETVEPERHWNYKMGKKLRDYNIDCNDKAGLMSPQPCISRETTDNYLSWTATSAGSTPLTPQVSTSTIEEGNESHCEVRRGGERLDYIRLGTATF